MAVRILTGHVLDVLATLPAESVHCVVTSPPYWGLRDYKVAPVIMGGDPACDHDWGRAGKRGGDAGKQGKGGQRADRASVPEQAMASASTGTTCRHCSAWRGQIGLEPTPERFVANMVEVFRAVRRVLRPDGTLWLNMGDCYATGAGKVGDHPGGGEQGARWRGGAPSERSTLRGNGHIGGGPKLKSLQPVRVGDQHPSRGTPNRDSDPGSARTNVGPLTQPNRMPIAGLKPKDLVGIPWRLAFALQADGWWLRQEIIWCLSGGAWLYARTPKCIGPMMLKDLVRLKPETVELWNGKRWTRVVAWTKRKGRVDALELALRSGERIGCTSNHVWPTGRGNLRTDELRQGDVIQTAILPDHDTPSGWLTDDAFWFAGLYLAEGSRSGETIQISGHAKETHRIARIKALTHHYGGSARAYTSGNNLAIHIDSIGLAAVLRTLIAGRTARDKHLAPGTWLYRSDKLRKLAEGYLEGDGCKDGARVRLVFCRNYALERDLRTLAARLGATLTLKPTTVKNQTGRRFPSFQGEWRWTRSGHHNERDRGEVVAIRRSRARHFWDVAVADDPHLFALSSGVLTHNSKPNPMPESVTDRCTKAHEHLFLLTKAERYYYDQEAILEDTSPNTHARLSLDVQAQIGSDRANAGNRRTGNMKAVARHGGGNRSHKGETAYREGAGEHRTKEGLVKFSAKMRKRAEAGSGIKNNDSMDAALAIMPLKRNKRSVWTVATEPFSEAHFATFPPKLIEPCILAGSPKGGTVLDPFGGAGTTGLVADRLGRNAILIELSEQYTDMARRRIRGDAPLLAEVS